MSRTPASWLKIITFYIIFYACIALVWALYLIALYQTIDYSKPKHLLEASVIGTNPAVSVRPLPHYLKTQTISLTFDKNDLPENKNLIDDMKLVMRRYTTSNTTDNMIDCVDDSFAPPGKFCKFDWSKVPAECREENDFGYHDGKPCLMLRVNRIFDWEPVPYTDEDLKSNKLPLIVKENYEKNKGGQQLIYLTCTPDNPSNAGNLGEIKYYPEQGVRFHHYPYTNQEGYLSPFVFVQFANMKSNVKITVNCQFWAKNIIANHKDKEGMVHFHLKIDEQ